jgi:type I restriction enzyme M protein
MSDIVNKLWGFCHTLKHDGIGYAFYVEQLTFMLFIKMAEERGVQLPKKCDWNTLSNLSGTELVDGYTDMLRALGKTQGILGDIFAGAQNRFNKAVNLKKLISLIGEVEWSSLGEDVKAHAYEGLLEKAASEGKKGAGQYFTPRVLIQTIVRCMKPDPRAAPDFTLCDPACGTGGFLVAVHEWLAKETKGAMDRDVAKRVRSRTYFGGDIDQEPRRLALMNLYLHGIEPHIKLGDAIYEPAQPERHTVILSNPPFGTRGANQAPERDDFTVSTSNKQLNFVQHILTLLKDGGRAAIVLPDNCLFEDQAGEVFKILMEDCDLHTVLRLPRGTFTPYSNGVMANVVFFTKGQPSTTTWIYDARTNVPHITKKDRPLTPEHFKEFEKCFGVDPNGRAKRKASDSKEDRWRSFSGAEVKERSYKLDGFKWLKDDSFDEGDDLPEPEELATEAVGQLEGAVAELNAVLRLLETDDVRQAT